MATYWNSGNDYRCFGYAEGSYYDSSYHEGYSLTGDSSTYDTLSGNYKNYIASGVQWGQIDDNGNLRLKIGNDYETWIWVYAQPKRIYIVYKDSESEFSKETYVNCGQYDTSISNYILSVEELNTFPEAGLKKDNSYLYVYYGNDTNTDIPTLSVPIGKKFKGWNTAADGSGIYYNVGDEITRSASYMYKYDSIVLYAIWEWDGLGNIGGKKALCYICDGHDENNNPIWKQVLPYAYIRNSESVLDWRLGIGGSS